MNGVTICYPPNDHDKNPHADMAQLQEIQAGSMGRVGIWGGNVDGDQDHAAKQSPEGRVAYLETDDGGCRCPG